MPARAYPGGPVVYIRWYFADEGAPWYPHGHCWEPILYYADKLPIPDTAGELADGKRRRVPRTPPRVKQTMVACGTEADFAGEGSPPLLRSGRPDFARVCGCGYIPTIGFQPKTIFRRHFVADLCLEAAWTDSLLYLASYAAEWCMEATWHDLTVTDPYPAEWCMEAAWEQLDGVEGFAAELCMEGAWDQLDGEESFVAEWCMEGSGTVGFTFGGSYAADMCLEAPTFEGDPPEGTWLVEACFEAATFQGDPPEGSWSIDACFEVPAFEGDPADGSWSIDACFEVPTEEGDPPDGTWAADLALECEGNDTPGTGP